MVEGQSIACNVDFVNRICLVSFQQHVVCKSVVRSLEPSHQSLTGCLSFRWDNLRCWLGRWENLGCLILQWSQDTKDFSSSGAQSLQFVRFGGLAGTDEFQGRRMEAPYMQVSYFFFFFFKLTEPTRLHPPNPPSLTVPAWPNPMNSSENQQKTYSKLVIHCGVGWTFFSWSGWGADSAGQH